MTVAVTMPPPDPAEARRLRKAEARARRNELARERRRQTEDQRTRAARRVRAIEADLRAQLRRQGRVVTVHDDILIGGVAQLMLRLEILRVEQSRGTQDVTDEELTRLANSSQRLLSQLGLKPQLAQPPAPRLEEYLTKQDDPA